MCDGKISAEASSRRRSSAAVETEVANWSSGLYVHIGGSGESVSIDDLRAETRFAAFVSSGSL